MRTADSIIVMEQGRVVEEGTHEDLVMEGGIYASLVARQTSTESKAQRDPRIVSKGADSVAEARRTLEKQVMPGLSIHCHCLGTKFPVTCPCSQTIACRRVGQYTLHITCAIHTKLSCAWQAREEQETAKEHGQRNGQAGAIPVGEEASNAVPMSKRSLDASSDSVDDSALLEEYCPDTPEPARGKNKHSQS